MIDRRKFLLAQEWLQPGQSQDGFTLRRALRVGKRTKSSPWIWEMRQVLCHTIGKRRSGPIERS